MIATRNPIVVLITDFGWNDSYVGEVKCALWGINPALNILDLCHTILPYNVRQAAQVLGYLYKHFPQGAICLGIVDPGVGSQRTGIVLETGGLTFIGPDNGIFSIPYAAHESAVCWRIREEAFPSRSFTFHGRDIFAPVAARLSLGEGFSPWLEPLAKAPSLLDDCAPLPRADGFEGEIIYIDRFGNCATNFPAVMMASGGKMLTVHGRTIADRVDFFRQGKPGEVCLMENSYQLIEIIANQASAADLLGVRVGDRVLLK